MIKLTAQINDTTISVSTDGKEYLEEDTQKALDFLLSHVKIKYVKVLEERLRHTENFK